MIVTIDGPAGSGKSTAARGLAVRLGFHFLDTGAMYRVVALECLKRQVDIADERQAAAVAHSVEISFSKERVFADGVDVSEEIRSPEVTRASSVVAMHSSVRQELVRLQRKVAAGLNVVCEGRDQGTVVFPDAECKFFLTADPRQRAVRRQRELAKRGGPVDLDVVQAELLARDHRDANRNDSPLIPADDAEHIDTSDLNPTQVLDLLERIAREKLRLLDEPQVSI